MSVEGGIAVIERIIKAEEILLEQTKSRLKSAYQTINSLELNLESNKKRLEELLDEARKSRLQSDSGSGQANPLG